MKLFLFSIFCSYPVPWRMPWSCSSAVSSPISCRGRSTFPRSAAPWSSVPGTCRRTSKVPPTCTTLSCPSEFWLWFPPRRSFARLFGKKNNLLFFEFIHLLSLQWLLWNLSFCQAFVLKICDEKLSYEFVLLFFSIRDFIALIFLYLLTF